MLCYTFSGSSPQDNPTSRMRWEKEEENALIVKNVTVNIKIIQVTKLLTSTLSLAKEQLCAPGSLNFPNNKVSVKPDLITD